MDVIDKVSFDLSLARDLDYYTGLIYKVVVDSTDQPTNVGGIAAGGRYDDLVGMYSRGPLPCIGISFGVDRIVTLLDARHIRKSDSDLALPAEVYIMEFGGKNAEVRIRGSSFQRRILWRK